MSGSRLPGLPLEMIVSGGQSGLDRAALDWAIAHGIPHGGWCPQGRLAADGVLAPRYQLRETDSTGYRQRTRRNVEDSDATLIVNRGELGGGSRLTAEFARKLGRPWRVLPLDEPLDSQLAATRQWLAQTNVRVLNIAGPGEERYPGIAAAAFALLDRLLAAAPRQKPLSTSAPRPADAS